MNDIEFLRYHVRELYKMLDVLRDRIELLSQQPAPDPRHRRLTIDDNGTVQLD
jgi:hypothetical protein